MAEAWDLVFEMASGAGGAGVMTQAAGTKFENRNVERLNLLFLAVGKLMDLVVDWVLVVQVFSLSAPVSGCTDTCEYANNFVCQDGLNVTSLTDVARQSGTCIVLADLARGSGACIVQSMSSITVRFSSLRRVE